MRSVSISSGRGFSRKLSTRPSAASADEPVAARVGDGREQDRRLRARRAMERDQLAEVGLAQRVAVQREEAALELAAGEADRAARPERLVLDRVLEREAAVPRRRSAPRSGRAGSRTRRSRARRRAARGARTCTRAAAGRRAGACPSACGRSAGGAAFPGRRRGSPPAGSCRSARPMPSYANPSARSASGSSTLRPSTSDAVAHPRAGRGPVELAQLGPLGHEHGGVGAVERLERRVARSRRRGDARARRRPGPRRVTSAPSASSRAGEHEARRLAHVVRPGLEREPEQRDRLAAQRPESPLELPDRRAASGARSPR